MIFLHEFVVLNLKKSCFALVRRGHKCRTIIKAFLVGVVSRGKGCARKNTVGIYTRVKKYLRWIQTVTKNGKCHS